MSKLSGLLGCAAVTSSLVACDVEELPQCLPVGEGSAPRAAGLLEAPIDELWWVPAHAERWILDEELVVEEVLRTPTITALRVPAVRTVGPHRLVGDDVHTFEVDADAAVVRAAVDGDDPLQGFGGASSSACARGSFVAAATTALQTAAADDVIAADVWTSDSSTIDDLDPLAPRLLDTVLVQLDATTPATIIGDARDIDLDDVDDDSITSVRVRLRSLIDGRTGNVVVVER